MKYSIFPVALLFGFFGILSGCGNDFQSSTANLSSKTDSLSYSFGYLQGSNLVNEGIDDVDIKKYVAGLNTALEEGESQIDQMAMQSLIQTYLQDLQMQQMERQAAEADVNIEQGKAFLEENLQSSDVHETDSGLQYRVLEEGDGARPTASDQVEVHYRGTLINDEVFDSSYDRGEPVTFPLNRVIPGWTEGLQLMTVGSRYQFFIPSDLGYGNNPPPGSNIPPGAVLIFEVELLDIK
jgi:FKBP-type peptidyl-prolyl cis-trans isomerase